MNLTFKQDHAGIKTGETLNPIDVRQRLEYAVYFSDAALRFQLIHAGIAIDPDEIRTATIEDAPTKRKAVSRGGRRV